MDANASRGSVEVTDDPPPGWEAFVAATPGATFCHLPGWKHIMSDVLGHPMSHAVVRGPTGDLRGVLGLVSVHSRLFGRYVVSMPFLNYGGPLGDAASREQLVAWALGRARAERAKLLELRWRQAARTDRTGDEDLPAGVRVSARKVTVTLALPTDAEALFTKGLKAKVRSQVRRPMKEGLEARFGADEVPAFYEVFARNMRDLGTPVLPRRLFESLVRTFAGEAVVCVVRKGDEPVAAGFGFHWRDEFELTWASSLREYNPIAPNMLLYWRLMEHAIARGATTFNFGRCTPGGGTHAFKLQWGGVDEPLPWAAWSPDGSFATPNPDEGKFALAVRAWQRLPLGVSRLLGPPLARRIP